MAIWPIIGIGLILRVWQLNVPSYWMDESFSIAIAQSMLEFEWPFRSAFYHGLLAFVGVASWNVTALRLLSVVIGMIMVIIGYTTAKRLFTPTLAVVFSVLISVATIEITWSRQIRMYSMLQLLFWVSLYCYYQWRIGKMHWTVPLVTTVATVLTHEFGLYLLLVYLWYEVLQRTRRPLYWILISLVVTFIIVHLAVPTLPYINYWWHYLYWIGTEYVVWLVLGLTGIYALSKKYLLLTQWLLLIWLGWLLCLAFIIPLLQYRYLFMTMPIILLLASVGVVWLWQKNWIGKLVLGICLSLLVWQQQLTVIPHTFYPLESDSPSPPFGYKTFTPQPNFTAAYAFLLHYPESLVATPYPVIHRLYTGELPDYAIFVNLTGGSYPEIPAAETYTGMAYTDPTELPMNREVFVLIDQFAEYRLDPRWKTALTSAEIIWQDNNPPWSTLTIYYML